MERTSSINPLSSRLSLISRRLNPLYSPISHSLPYNSLLLYTNAVVAGLCIVEVSERQLLALANHPRVGRVTFTLDHLLGESIL